MKKSRLHKKKTFYECCRCDNKKYCGNDPNSIWMGQKNYITKPSDRENIRFFPLGWTDIETGSSNETVLDIGRGLCVYTGNTYGNKALCNRKDLHSLDDPEKSLYYICGKIKTTQHVKKCFVKYLDKFPKVCEAFFEV